jgi:hypothetical protein
LSNKNLENPCKDKGNVVKYSLSGQGDRVP